MRGSNLDINIVVNSDKARADLELLKAQFRATTKEIKALSNEAAKTGDRTKLDAAIPAARAMEAQLKSLNRTFAQTGDAMEQTGRQALSLSQRFTSLSRSGQNLAGVLGGIAGGFAGGIIGQAAFRGLEALGRQISEVHQGLLKLRDTAAELGTRPSAVEAARRIVEREGGKAEDADKILGGAAEALAKFRTAAGAPIDSSGVTVFRGGIKDAGEAARQAALEIGSGVNVIRGSKQQVFDLSQAYALVGVNLAKYKDTSMAAEKVTVAAIQGFLKLADSGRLGASQLNALSKELFKGIPADSMLRQAPALLKQLADEIKNQAPIVPPRIAAAQELETQKGRVKQVFTDIKLAINDVWTSWDIATTTALANFLTKTLPQFGTDVATFFTNLWPNTVKAFQDAWADTEKLIAPLTEAFQNLFNSIGPMAEAAFNSVVSVVTGVVQGIADAVRSAVARTQSALGGAATAGAPVGPGGFASGGFIRGPGSDTSDSILARLSNGEFVMRARAVEHWGPRFMAALNAMQNPFGYHAGGLVRSRFADGGLVAAGGGSAPVHLHLGGREFALAGSVDVVGSLVAHARQSQMRSSGVKPSWYGGRPNN